MTRKDRPLGEGAADFAPTAPHATPASNPSRVTQKRTKVGRIWKPLGLVSGGALALSALLHGAVAVTSMGTVPDVSFKETDDELTIPVDMFEEGQAASPPPPPPPVAHTGPAGQDGAGLIDAGTKPVRDAGVPSIPDAGVDAGPKPKPVRDAGTAVPLGSDALDGGAGDGGSDAGSSSSSGPADPQSIVGMPGLVSSGPVNVTLLINMAAIRKHPVGSRIGPLIARVPQWESFTRGNQTQVDPLRDTDWVLVYGPSLIKTEKDAVLVHYSASDAVVDAAIDLMAQQYDKGGPFDTGVPGVKASLARADNAERVFLRASSKLLAVVPPERAKEFARLLKSKGAKPKVNPLEAMRLIVHKPHRQISVPGLKFPTELEELRLWVVPNADGTADVFAEGTVVPDVSCPDVALFMNDVLKRLNTGLVQSFSAGLLNKANVECDEGVPKAHIVASQKQIEAILAVANLAL